MKSYMLFYEMKRHVRETGHQAYAVELSNKDRNGKLMENTSEVAQFTCLNCVISDPNKFVEMRAEENRTVKKKNNAGD